MKRGCRYLILLVLFALLGSTSLSATEMVRIGLVTVHATSGNQSLLQDLSDRIENTLQQRPAGTSYNTLIAHRLQQESMRAELKRMHDSKEVIDPMQHEVENREGPFPIVIERITVQDETARALRQSDELVADFLMKREGLDVLLVCIFEPFQMLSRIRITEFRSDGSYLSVHEGLSLPQDSDTLRYPAVLDVISHYQEEELSLVVFDRSAPGLTIRLDGKLVEHTGNMLLLSPGEHTLEVSALGIETERVSISLQPNSIERVSLRLDEREGFALLVTSFSGTAQVSIPSYGSRQVPVIVESVKAPLVLYARDQGLTFQTLHITKPIEEITLSLQPQWMDPVQGTAREQRSMYASLGRSLLLGGLTILIDSLSRSVTSDPSAWQPVILASAGACAVSLFDTGSRLFAYYQKTKYSSRY